MAPSLVRLSDLELLILRLLVDGGEMYGLELVGASEGRLKRGTVYVTLGRMEAKGYLVSREGVRAAGASGLPRPLYRPTALGQKALRASRALEALAQLTEETS